MGTRTCVLMLTAVMLPAAAAAEDNGSGLKSFMETAREIAIPAPPATPHNGHKYFSRDCARLELGPAEGPVESIKASLTTQEFTEICTPVPSGDTGLIIEHCFHSPGRTWTRSVSLLARPRQLPPGMTEVFEVCLEGAKLELAQMITYHPYSVEVTGTHTVLFTLTPAPEDPPPSDRSAVRIRAGHLAYPNSRP
ncbi:MAG: hypothetical protein NTX59_03925 [Elusimicrobia bacterium]|nr:hypothetical protein [Elusimicrobiota bacterium]